MYLKIISFTNLFGDWHRFDVFNSIVLNSITYVLGWKLLNITSIKSNARGCFKTVLSPADVDLLMATQ